GDRRNIRARFKDVHVAHAHALVDRSRFEEADQIAEVAAIAGTEEPSEVIREVLWLGLAAVGGPRGCQRTRRFGRVLAQAREPSALERRDHEGVITGVRLEASRTEQARIREI